MMEIQINSKIIYIPPYISLTWDKVSLLLTEQDPFNDSLILVLQLKDGKSIRVPDLEFSVIEQVFEQHHKHLIEKHKEIARELARKEDSSRNPLQLLQQMMGLGAEQLGGLPVRFGITGLPGIEGVETATQHNPQQAHIPDLPQEVLEKIVATTRMILGAEANSFSKPEAHCNCVHCQIARVFHGVEKTDVEEIVMQEELTFRDWEVVAMDENRYKVINPLDKDEAYTVFLGTPLGCTCGQNHCEHIKSVLLS